MILPNKYLSLMESYIGLSAFILDIILDKKMTIDEVWNKLFKKHFKKLDSKYQPNYQKYISVLEFMFITGMINYNDKGEIFNENIKHNS